MMADSGLLSTDEAAELLGVKTETIYTYVSRGRLESIRKPGIVASWFRRSDVERLAGARHNRRPNHDSDVSRINTAICEIDGTTYRYRGREPRRLVDHYTFEQVAEFLWTGRLPAEQGWDLTSTVDAAPVGDDQRNGESLPLDRLRVAVSVLATADHLRFGRPRDALVVTGRQLMTDLVAALTRLGPEPEDSSIAAVLWSRLSETESTPVQLAALEKALIVAADHSIAPTTLAARIAASYGADLYGCVETGLAVLAGAWHGGRALSAESMMDDIERVGDAEIVVGELYRQGAIPCLGQPRYQGSDPRTDLIAGFIEDAMPGNPTSQAFEDVRRITKERALPSPSFELALAVLAKAFGFTKGSSEALFAISRTAGWIAHAIEVYRGPTAGPPEYAYVGTGPIPETADV